MSFLRIFAAHQEHPRILRGAGISNSVPGLPDAGAGREGWEDVLGACKGLFGGRGEV